MIYVYIFENTNAFKEPHWVRLALLEIFVPSDARNTVAVHVMTYQGDLGFSGDLALRRHKVLQSGDLFVALEWAPMMLGVDNKQITVTC